MTRKSANWGAVPLIGLLPYLVDYSALAGSDSGQSPSTVGGIPCALASPDSLGGANNLKALALMRKEAANKQAPDQIDVVYKNVKPVREERCGKGK
jgi:hypothetical protein